MVLLLYKKNPKMEPGILTNDQINELCEDLRGTCKNEDEALSQVTGVPPGTTWDSLKHSDYQEIDQQIFRCEKCDWWCGADEESQVENLDGQRICDDCEGED